MNSNPTKPSPSSAKTSLSLVIASEQEQGVFERITSENVLAPGYYWRLKNDLEIQHPTWKEHTYKLHTGDVHLLLDIFEYEGSPHTAIVLCHPRNGVDTELRILIADFLANFEPEKDADAVRAKEQAQIMTGVQDIQEEMAQAQINPLGLPGMREALDKAVAKFEQSMVAENAASQKDEVARVADLRKIHRRAARRSAAAGNPLVVRSVTISDQVGHMISGGINSDGLQELTVEARRRIAIAEATSVWLTERAKHMGRALESLTPYFAEKGKVALARASKAISYVKGITQGLNSLKLYTGDGVDVVPITEGASASTALPLTLVQGKRYMDEELAVWADVADSFDWSNQSQFFDALKANDSLVDLVFPTQRCVVSIAVTRRKVRYDANTSAYEVLMNQIRNRAVFLLVRDGQNIHAVYSAEPSHETTARLFPTAEDLEKPFQGIDGSTIGLQDVAFGKSVERFDDVALHYKRFLILLCGLDHRMKLMGEFYPPELNMQFMSLNFQHTYFNFLQDDDGSRLIGDGLEPVSSWIKRCNQAVRSGSRIVVSTGNSLVNSSPQMKRLNGVALSKRHLPEQLIATRAKGHHQISVPIERRYTTGNGMAHVWLDGPEADHSNDWFLCMDLARLEAVRRYIYHRTSRIGSIAWLRTFKRAEAILLDEQEQQAPLRAVLAQAAVGNGILSDTEVDEAIYVALATWRAARRGADAPESTDTKSVNELLSLMYPSDRMTQSTDAWVDALIQELGTEPLMLCRTGKNRLVLYVVASAQDKAPYATGVHFGWVKRVLIDVLKTKISVASSALVWLEKAKPNAAEVVLREWPALQEHLHPRAEPTKLKWLESFKSGMSQATEQLEAILAAGRAASCKTGFPEELLTSLIQDARTSVRKDNQGHPRIVIPVGVVQRHAGKAVAYLYACAFATVFVSHYGTIEQFARYCDGVYGGYNYRVEKALQHSLSWALYETQEPFKNTILDQKVTFSILETSSIRSHLSGGYTKKQLNQGWFFHQNKTTRAERRAAGGMPQHQSQNLPLSWNRSIESLLEITSRQRKKFKSEQARISREYGADSEYHKPRTPIVHDLSSLVWNPAQGRSVANRYFSVQKQLLSK